MIIFIGNNNNVLTRHIYKNKELKKCIKILPNVPHDKSNIYYAMSDVYINSSHEEVFGKVIVEAFELGLPVIGYRGGSHLELIKHDYNGLLYKSAQELCENIKKLCKNKSLIELYGKQAHWFYKLKIPTVIEFYNTFGNMMEICKNNMNFPINFSLSKNNDKYGLSEFNMWENNNFLYVMGGFDEHTNDVPFLHKINMDTLEIDKTINIPNDCAKTHVSKIIYDDNVFFVSGQIDEKYGNSGNSFYIFSHDPLSFFKINELETGYYDLKGFVKNKELVMFSGTTNDRSTPNSNVMTCEILNDNNEFIATQDTKWNTHQTDCCVGTCHSILLNCKNDKHIYISGCQCHACAQEYIEEWHMYIHNQKNYMIDMNLNKNEISQQQFQVSHTQTSSFYYEPLNAVIVIGGQSSYDGIYYGLQIYYIDYNIWVNMSLKKDEAHIFTKSCGAIICNNKLYVIGGQQISNKFNKKISVFNIG